MASTMIRRCLAAIVSCAAVLGFGCDKSSPTTPTPTEAAVEAASPKPLRRADLDRYCKDPLRPHAHYIEKTSEPVKSMGIDLSPERTKFMGCVALARKYVDDNLVDDSHEAGTGKYVNEKEEEGFWCCPFGASAASSRPNPPPPPSAAPSAPPSTSSFACGSTRCSVGQRCCPGAPKACIEKGDVCAVGSETTVGYLCDPKSSEPCADGKHCVSGKVGAGPLTMTAECR